MFTGSIVALITPMDEDGAIDRVSLKKLIEYHVVSGTKAKKKKKKKKKKMAGKKK